MGPIECHVFLVDFPYNNLSLLSYGASHLGKLPYRTLELETSTIPVGRRRLSITILLCSPASVAA